MKTSSTVDSSEKTHEEPDPCSDETVFTKCVNYEQSAPEEIFTKCVNYEQNVAIAARPESYGLGDVSSTLYEEIVESVNWQTDIYEQDETYVDQETGEQTTQQEIQQEICEPIQTELPQDVTKTVVPTPQQEYTVDAPPPVPKRTLLPAEPIKSKVTSKHEATEPESVSQYVTPISTVASTPQHEKSLAENVEIQNVRYRDIDPSSPDSAQKVDAHTERWSDSTTVSLPGQVEDIETVSSDPGNVQDAASEMYYTASSEVSLLSDTDQDKVHDEEDKDKDDRKNVIAGHVAAMRERFESMTRANTPCPDLVRSLSPSLEVFRNISPSPDRMA